MKDEEKCRCAGWDDENIQLLMREVTPASRAGVNDGGCLFARGAASKVFCYSFAGVAFLRGHDC
jgi:hypothetical protein